MDGKAFKDALKNFGSYEEKKQFSKEDKKPDDGWTGEQDKAETKMLEDIFNDKKPDSETVESFSSKSPEEVAKHVSEKIRATSEFMEPEEFDKLLAGKASSSAEDNEDEEETSEGDSSKSQGSKEWAEDLLQTCKQELSKIESSGEEGKAAAEKLGLIDFYKDKIAALEKELADGSYEEKSSTAAADKPAEELAQEPEAGTKKPRSASKAFVKSFLTDLYDSVTRKLLKDNIESGMPPAEAFAKAINDGSIDYWVFDAAADNGNVVLTPNGVGGHGMFRKKVLDSGTISDIVNALTLEGNEPAEE